MAAVKMHASRRESSKIKYKTLLYMVLSLLVISLPAVALGEDFIATGTYTGNNASELSITGLGFQPDMVIVKSVEAKEAFARTSDMPAGLSKNLAKSEELKDDRILSLDADGFTIGGQDYVNKPDVTYYWVAMKARSGSLELGQYTGDGQFGHQIPLSLQEPDAAIIIPAINKLSAFRHSDMDLSQGFALDGSGEIANSFSHFDATGFTIDTGDEVNKSGETYYFVAWKAEANVIEVGNYNGNNLDDRDISGLNVDPDFILISNDTNEAPVLRPDSVLGDATLYFDNREIRSNLIQSMYEGGIQVGNDSSVNENTNNYHWLAISNPLTQADLVVTTTVDDSTPDELQSISLEIGVENLGPNQASGVEIANILPAGLTYISSVMDQGSFDEGSGLWTLGDIDSGQSFSLTIVASPDAGTAGTILSNSAMVSSSSTPDPDAANNTDSVDITVVGTSGVDLAVTMAVSESTVDEGQAYTYTVSVTNNGPNTASNVEVTDALPLTLGYSGSVPSMGSYNDGTGVWDLTSINVGATHTLAITVTPNAGTSGTNITNTAAVTALDETDPNSENDSISVDVSVNALDIQVLSFVGNSSPEVGATVNLTVIASNLGPAEATNLQINDLIPSGLTFVSSTPNQGSYNDATGVWDIGTLAKTLTRTLVIAATVDAGGEGTTITNTATLANVDQSEINLANNSSSAGMTVETPGEIDLQLSKIVNNTAPNVGDLVTFTLTVFNAGPGDATGIEVLDSLPAEVSFVSVMTNKGTYEEGTGLWTIDDLATGFQAVLDIQVLVEASAIGATVTNTASITAADQVDPDLTNNTASVSFFVSTCDLQLTKVVDNSTPSVGESISYTVSLTNAGPNAASGIQVTDVLPAGTTFISADGGAGSYDQASGIWTAPGLNPGLSDSLVINALVASSAAGSSVVNTATITTLTQADPSPGNDEATASITPPGSDLALTLASSALVAFEGTSIDLTLTITNGGPNQGTAIQATQLVPNGLTIDSVTPSQGSYHQGTGLWTVGTIDNASSATLGLTVSVDGGTAGTIIANAASITANHPADPNADNNTFSVSITVPDGVPTGNSIWPIGGTSSNALPGDPELQEVLLFVFTNQSSQSDTLHSLTLTNLTQGDGTLAQMDAEWQALSINRRTSSNPSEDLSDDFATGVFSSGSALFDALDWAIPAGDTMLVTVVGGPSLQARDSAQLQVGILENNHLEFNDTYILGVPWPLTNGQTLHVDGFAAAQAAIIPLESGLLAIGSADNLALTVDLPGNGYLDDTLYGFSIKNNGSAQPMADISAVKIWSDDGDGLFDPVADDALGYASYSGDRWQLTGLNVPVPSSGQRFFTSVDIAETALPSRDIRLSLPVGNGFAVEMFSGNDGPVDLSLENPSTLGISDTDRIILFPEWSYSGTTLPGTNDATLLQFQVTNTYADERQLQSFTFTNTTEAPGSTVEQRDAICQQVYLIHDANENGELDDVTVDKQLGSGIFVDGKVLFSGLALDLAPNTATRLFVTADFGMVSVADGNRIKGEVESISDLSIPNATVVATWPLESGVEWLINGMISEQISNRSVTIVTLGPNEGPVLAMDLTIPANGYLEDELFGISFNNEGSATTTDLFLAELWEDGGDGIFNAGGGDDQSLGPLTLTANAWTSSLLSRPIPLDGIQLFTSIIVADTPQDSVTVKLGVPQGGITVSSGNDGPVDSPVAGGSTLVISTSPLRTSVVFAEEASNLGQGGTITMSVHNAGSETVTDIYPDLSFGSGTDLLALHTVSPEFIAALAPGGDATFTWNFDSENTGEVVMEGNSQGLVSGSQVRRSIVTPTSPHTIYSPVPGLDLYPTANLPFSINRGQQGIVPLTLTFINPGGLDVADAELSSIRLRLLESEDGPGIIPSQLLDQVVIAEGTNIYYESTLIPSSGDELILDFSEPVIVTGDEPVTLGLRLGLRNDSEVTSFLISLEEAGWLMGQDAVDGSALIVSAGEGSFPIRTGQATLVSQAVGLNLAVVDHGGESTVPGQNQILLAEINLSQSVVSDNSSSIDLGQLAFEFHDADGHHMGDPSQYFSRLSLTSAFQEHYSGMPVVESDSLVVLPLSSPVTVVGSTTLVLRLFGDIAESSPLGQVTPLLGAVDFFDARDGNMNNSVPVFWATGPECPPLNILGPSSDLTAAGIGSLPNQVSQGTRNLTALTLTLANAGAAGSSSSTCDTLVLGFFNAAREPLNITPYIDRLRVWRGTDELGSLIDPETSGGMVTIALSGLKIQPGQQTDIQINLDIKSDAPTGSLEVVLDADGIIASDSISGQPIGILPASGSSLPIFSSVGTIVAPADELTVAATNLMPPLLVPDDNFSPVFSLVLSNPAAENSGGIQLNALTLSQNATKADNPNLGELLAVVRLRQDDEVVALATDLDLSANSVTLAFEEAFIIDAASSATLILEVLLKEDALPGALSLVLAEDSIDAGPPGGGGVAIRVLAESGQTFPFVSETGNIGQATLAESYANFPNPFAAGREPTTFAFSLLQDAEVNLRIMTPHGELVATILEAEHRAAGFYQDDLWQGKNGNGAVVHNGVYLAELVVRYSDGSNERILRKVAVVR